MVVRGSKLGVRHALGAWWCSVASALLIGAVAGCTGINPCDKRGVTEACECASGQQGVRVCLPERVWDHCACGGSASDAGVAGRPGTGGASGVGGMSGGSGTTGMSGMSGSSASGSGGSGGTMTDPDDDAGMDPAGSGGTGGSAGSAGSSGTGGSGGSAGTMATNPYKRCTAPAECGAGATCESTTDPDDPVAMIRACAPACTDKAMCPMPMGSFAATLECIDAHCRLDCTPPAFGADLTCPTGMRCASTGLLAPSYCF